MSPKIAPSLTHTHTHRFDPSCTKGAISSFSVWASQRFNQIKNQEVKAERANTLDRIQNLGGSPSVPRTLHPCRVSRGAANSEGPAYDTQFCFQTQDFLLGSVVQSQSQLNYNQSHWGILSCAWDVGPSLIAVPLETQYGNRVLATEGDTPGLASWLRIKTMQPSEPWLSFLARSMLWVVYV